MLGFIYIFNVIIFLSVSWFITSPIKKRREAESRNSSSKQWQRQRHQNSIPPDGINSEIFKCAGAGGIGMTAAGQSLLPRMTNVSCFTFYCSPSHSLHYHRSPSLHWIASCIIWYRLCRTGCCFISLSRPLFLGNWNYIYALICLLCKYK